MKTNPYLKAAIMEASGEYAGFAGMMDINLLRAHARTGGFTVRKIGLC